MSPRRRVEEKAPEQFSRRAPHRGRPVGLVVLMASAVVVLIAALTAGTLLLITHEQHRTEAVRNVAVISYVRGFMTQYTSPDPMRANDYADAVLDQATGQLAQDYQQRINEIVVQVARAEPTTGTVLDAGVERWNDDGSADVLVATKTVTTFPDGRTFEDGSRWVATAIQEGDQWKISNLLQVILTDDTGSEPPRTPVGKARRRTRTVTADVTAESVPAEEPVAAAPRRAAAEMAPAAIGAAAVVFVGAGAFTASTLQPYVAHRALVDTKLDIARTAADAITTLWTYTPENMESLADRSARFLGGDFEAQYRKYVDAIAPTNKQAQVTNNTQVVGAAVESVSGRDATAIVYTNSTATSPLSKDIPSLRYLSYRLTLQREGSQWLVTSMDTITSLDLTPQL